MKVVVAAPVPSAPSLSPYEVERSLRVARNEQAMRELGVTKASQALTAPSVWKRTKPGVGGAERRAKRPAEAAPEPPARVSKRIRVRAGLAEAEPDGSASELDTGADVEDERVRMLSVDEFLDRKGLAKGMHPDATPKRLQRCQRRARRASARCDPPRATGRFGCASARSCSRACAARAFALKS